MKKLAIILGVIAAVFGITWGVLSWLVIDRDALTAEVRDTLASATGREVQVQDGAAVDLFPKPKITIPGLRIGNVKGASSEHFFSASQVVLHVNFISLFTGKPKIGLVEVDGPLMELETLPGGGRSWQFSGASRNGASFRDYFLNTPVRLHNGALRYTNSATGANAEFTGLNGTLSYEQGGAAISYAGDIVYGAESADVKVTIGSVDLSQPQVPDIPFELELENGNQKAHAKGKLVSATQDPEYHGAVELEFPRIAYAMGLGLPDADPVALSRIDQGGSVTAKGEVRLGVKGFDLQRFSLSVTGEDMIPVLKGEAELQYRFGQNPQIRFIPRFESVDLDYLLALYHKLTPPSLIASSGSRAEAQVEAANDAATGKFTWYGFLQTLQGGADINVDNLIYNGRTVKFVRILSQLDKGRITLSEAKANLPGHAWATFSGVAELKATGLEYSGKLEVQGQKMEDFLSLFAPRDADIPELSLGMFGIRSNMAITPEQFRLSEMQSRVSNTRIAGALILNRGDRPRLVSFLRMAGVDLDMIHKAVSYVLPHNAGVQQIKAGQGREALFDKEYVNDQFNWLASLGMQVDADFLLEDFVLFERQGKRAEFKLEMDVGRIALHEMNAQYNAADITGDYRLLAEPGKNPRIEVKGTISELNLADLFPSISRVQNEEEWQKFLDEAIDLKLLQIHTGRIEGRIGKLILRNYQFDGVETVLTLDNNIFVVDKFAGRLWNGNVNIRSVIQASSIPSLSTSFVLENADLTRFSQMTALVKHAAGRVGLRAQVSTSGVSLRSWFNNAGGAMSVVGRDISIQGFGLVGLARAVSVARKVSDLVNMKSSVMQSGVTRLNTLEGQLNIGKGAIDIGRLNFTSVEASGKVDGRANLIDETLDAAVEFYLLSTLEPGETPPVMTLTLKGPIDKLEKTLDMQHVEAFVARKAAERVLQDR